MDDVMSLIQQVLGFANDGKWWALAVVVIGAGVRLSKPDTWLPNLDARWRPLAAAVLGVVLGIVDLAVRGDTWQAALQWGLSAAVAAVVSHVLVVHVARDGKELPVPSMLRAELPAPKRKRKAK